MHANQGETIASMSVTALRAFRILRSLTWGLQAPGKNKRSVNADVCRAVRAGGCGSGRELGTPPLWRNWLWHWALRHFGGADGPGATTHRSHTFPPPQATHCAVTGPFQGFTLRSILTLISLTVLFHTANPPRRGGLPDLTYLIRGVYMWR